MNTEFSVGKPLEKQPHEKLGQ